MALLLAIDLSDPTDDLLAEAASWAERFSTTVDLVYVDQYPYSVQDPAVQRLLSVEWRKVYQGHEARLRELLEALPPAVRGTVSVRLGRAPQEIADAGVDHEAILIATHRRQGLPRVLLGSVAERVVRLSTVPVIVLPPKH